MLTAWLANNVGAVHISSGDSIQILAGMMIVGGLLSAVSVACMSQIYDTIADPLFGDYLREEEVFDEFLFWPQLTLLIQIVFVILCVLAIMVAITLRDNGYTLLAICVVIAIMIYTALKTWNLIEAMRLLAWHRQEYLFLLHQNSQRVNSKF
ncbi:MAG TPA: hypothetical protein VIM02_12510 [Rhizomicrobium sp.]